MGEVEQYRERSSALPLHFGVVAIEKGAFGSPSTMAANFTYTLLFDFLLCTCSVEYWPSTQPSIKKQVDPVEDIEHITLTCGQVEIGAIATPTGSRCISNNYITRCQRQFELVGVSCSWSSSCSSRQWEPAPSRGLGPSGPPVEQPSRMRKEVLL